MLLPPCWTGPKSVLAAAPPTMRSCCRWRLGCRAARGRREHGAAPAPTLSRSPHKTAVPSRGVLLRAVVAPRWFSMSVSLRRRPRVVPRPRRRRNRRRVDGRVLDVDEARPSWPRVAAARWLPIADPFQATEAREGVFAVLDRCWSMVRRRPPARARPAPPPGKQGQPAGGRRAIEIDPEKKSNRKSALRYHHDHGSA